MKKKQKKKSVKKQTKRTNNREYSNILLIFTGIFVLMIGYLVHFQVVKSRDTINNDCKTILFALYFNFA